MGPISRLHDVYTRQNVSISCWTARESYHDQSCPCHNHSATITCFPGVNITHNMTTLHPYHDCTVRISWLCDSHIMVTITSISWLHETNIHITTSQHVLTECTAVRHDHAATILWPQSNYRDVLRWKQFRNQPLHIPTTNTIPPRKQQQQQQTFCFNLILPSSIFVSTKIHVRTYY